MLLLETSNRILENLVNDRLNAEKFETVEVMAADFDGVQFHISTPSEGKNLLQISIQTRCGAELLKFGGADKLKAIYGPLLQASPEAGYDATLLVDLSAPPAGQTKETLAKHIAAFKRHLIAAPFLYVFEAMEKKAALPDIIAIHYRDQEAFYIKPEGDRVIVIFDVNFKDADDIVFSKVFLQEFADARRTISNAPAVTFSQKEPPLELRGVKDVKASESHGFISFVLFPNHTAAKSREKVVDLIQTFRDYLHYHIKCSKAQMHTSMRLRVESLLQILNRAKPEPVDSAKRTISGKTFKRA
eukprot:TRINITY_DN489_c0_g1_i1.p2 TRINITY_DN489_c0_g1~~TRINITY_DN489_c0_g1_i1.p2  ORF type:complete len:317 (-),score=122.68 TRINITY_DN489_c0_g1_i1:109-1011(-)